MNFEKLLHIDRRVIFVAHGGGHHHPADLPLRACRSASSRRPGPSSTPSSAIDPAKQALMVSTDYDAADRGRKPADDGRAHPPRPGPQAARCRDQLLQRVDPAGRASRSTQVMEEYQRPAQTASADSIVYGRDVVLLGWVPPPIVPILGMGQSITGVYKVDYYGAGTDTLPIMQGLQNYDEIGHRGGGLRRQLAAVVRPVRPAALRRQGGARRDRGERPRPLPLLRARGSSPGCSAG